MPGKMPGDACPGCKEGRLLVRTSNHSNEPPDVMQVVIGHRYDHWSTVSYLACSACFGMYEAANRGMNVKTVLEAQLNGFENPTEEPTACTACGGALCDQKQVGSFGFGVRPFRSCDSCLKVAWVFPKETRLDDDEPLLHGRGMPSPPVLSEGKRRKR